MRTAAASLALAGTLAAAGCGGGAGKPAAPAPPPAPVVVGRAVKRTVPVSLRGIGNVESVASVAVRSRVAGPILKVHIEDGVDVAKGQALFTIDPAPYRIAVERAEAQLARDQALLDKARSDVARYAKLVDKEYVTREQYEAAIAQASALAATIRVDQAATDDAELDLSYCTIAATIAGRAGSVSQRAGNLVKANDDAPLVTLLQVRPVYVAFSAPEKYLPEIRKHAAEGRLEVRARNRDESGDGHAGTLSFIDNTVDVATGTIRLRGEFPNDDRGLWPGQFVEVTLKLAEQNNAVVVPSSAVQVGQQGSYVFVVGADGTAQPRPVTVDRALDDETVIASGLDGGEAVIIDGQLRVVPGAKVAVQAEP